MLLRFGVQNHLSIREKQELSLVASSLKDTERGIIDCPAAPGGSVIPAVVIYGANASGKSNFANSIQKMRELVLLSHRRGEPGGGVRRSPFELDDDFSKTSTIFDADFVIEGVRYHYGFEASDDAYISEWLYVYPTGRRQTLFERQNQHFDFGRHLKGRNKVISELTRENSLYLSAATQNDHEELTRVSGFFGSIFGITATDFPGLVVSRLLPESKIDSRTIDFLQNIGTGVTDYRTTKSPRTDRMKKMIKAVVPIFQENANEAQRLAMIEELDRDSDVEIQLAHRGHDGKPGYIDLDHESAGTRRLLLLLRAVFEALDNGTAIVLDELDSSLHTIACEAVLELFASPTTNPRRAQLIATTHDTNLLRSPMLRRDQIWFTEKSGEGATHLYPLTDIRTRKNDNIEKGYLQGRYGAIPYSGSIDNLFSVA